MVKKYHFECKYNESQVNAERWNTANFEWKNNGFIEADSFEEFVQKFKQQFRLQLNEIEDWQTDSEVSENGAICASNSADGLGLFFRVTCQ